MNIHLHSECACNVLFFLFLKKSHTAIISQPAVPRALIFYEDLPPQISVQEAVQPMIVFVKRQLNAAEY